MTPERQFCLVDSRWNESVLNFVDLGEPTHTLVPCRMSKPLPLRNQCKGWFDPTELCRGFWIFIYFSLLEPLRPQWMILHRWHEPQAGMRGVSIN
jgi:hypothetical protein